MSKLFKTLIILLRLLISGLLTACVASTSTVVPTSTPVPTAVTTSVPVADPITIVNNFIDAVNAKDENKAKSFLADDVQCVNSCQFTGKDIFYVTIASLVAQGETLKMRDVKAISEDTLSFMMYIVDVNGTDTTKLTTHELAKVRDGKIIMMDFAYGY